MRCCPRSSQPRRERPALHAANTPLGVSAGAAWGRVVVKVWDRGPGLADNGRPRSSERFLPRTGLEAGGATPRLDGHGPGAHHLRGRHPVPTGGGSGPSPPRRTARRSFSLPVEGAAAGAFPQEPGSRPGTGGEARSERQPPGPIPADAGAPSLVLVIEDEGADPALCRATLEAEPLPA